MYIKDLKIGDRFNMTGNSTTYEATGVSYEPGQGCAITYVIPASAEPTYRFTFVKPGLSTCTLV